MKKSVAGSGAKSFASIVNDQTMLNALSRHLELNATSAPGIKVTVAPQRDREAAPFDPSSGRFSMRNAV